MTSRHVEPTPLMRAAYDYINQRDWTIIGVGADKKPVGSWSVGGWNRFDYTNSEQLFQHNFTAIAVVAGPSRLVIIDLDNDEAIRLYAEKFGTPNTRIIRTPRGRHLYYHAPAGITLSPATALLPGIDLRANESYAIAPPSVTSGGAYTIANDQPIAKLPESVLEFLTTTVTKQRDDNRIPDGAPIPEGTRNDTLWNRALRIIRAGLSDHAAYGAIEAEARALADGDITTDELWHIVDSARKYADAHQAEPEQSIDDIIASAATINTPVIGDSLELLNIEEMMLTDPPPIDWVWDGYLAKGTLNLLHGDAGLGKSMISLAIAARCTIGGELLNRSCSTTDVCMIDAENSQAEIHRRIRTAYDRASNTKRLHYYRADTAILNDQTSATELFAYIKHETNSELYILDSQRALWDGDEREQAEAGRMLRHLGRVAEALDICIIIIHHDTKAGQYSGSSDISAALTGSRLHLKRAATKDNPDDDAWNERHLVHAKCRIGEEQAVERFKIHVGAGIDLQPTGPTSDLDFIGRSVIAYAREHSAWPTIPISDIRDEMPELKARRTWEHVRSHLHGHGLIEQPRNGDRTVTFVSQEAFHG